MIPTLSFIVGAYLIYALIRAWPRRTTGYMRQRSGWRRFGWVALAGGAALGMGFFLWFSLSPEQQEQNLRMAEFLGTGWADNLTGKSDRRLEYPVVRAQENGEHPVYALLHPEMPMGQLGQQKAPVSPKALRKPRMQKAGLQAKGGKSLAPAGKKDRAAAAAKGRVKKKKQAISTTSAKATSG